MNLVKMEEEEAKHYATQYCHYTYTLHHSQQTANLLAVSFIHRRHLQVSIRSG